MTMDISVQSYDVYLNGSFLQTGCSIKRTSVLTNLAKATMKILIKSIKLF